MTTSFIDTDYPVSPPTYHLCHPLSVVRFTSQKNKIKIFGSVAVIGQNFTRKKQKNKNNVNNKTSRVKGSEERERGEHMGT